jgi:hypothetical protein
MTFAADEQTSGAASSKGCRSEKGPHQRRRGEDREDEESSRDEIERGEPHFIAIRRLRSHLGDALFAERNASAASVCQRQVDDNSPRQVQWSCGGRAIARRSPTRIKEHNALLLAHRDRRLLHCKVELSHDTSPAGPWPDHNLEIARFPNSKGRQKINDDLENSDCLKCKAALRRQPTLSADISTV